MTVSIDLAVILGILYITFLAVTIKILMQRDKKIKLEKYRLDIKYGANSLIDASLNNIIDSTFDEYRLYNLEFRDYDYIREMDEQKIIRDICNMVADRISPVFLTQLSTYFNSESIGNIIATRISTKVMEYKITNNIQGGQNKS